MLKSKQQKTKEKLHKKTMINKKKSQPHIKTLNMGVID